MRALPLCLLLGCTTVRAPGSIAGPVERATVRYASGATTTVPKVEIAGDGIKLPGGGGVPAEALQSVRWRPADAQERGERDGALIGAPLGFVAGAIFGAAAHRSCPPARGLNFCIDPISAGALALVCGFLGFGVAGVGGTLIGGGVGHHEEVTFTPPR